MATLARPASRQARMTRTAISPRLAMRTLRSDTASYLLLDGQLRLWLVPQSTEIGELREGETAHFATIVSPSATICDVGGTRSVQVVAAAAAVVVVAGLV